MKSFTRFLMVLVAALAVLAMTPLAVAQCDQAREFGAQGNGSLTHRIKIDTGPFTNDGNELGSLWQLGNTTVNSGGPHFGGPDLCPENVTDWYLTGGMFLGFDSGIQGFIASPQCQLTTCLNTGASLVTVVEDQTDDGASAGFIMYVIDETPPSVRWYDQGRTGDGGASPGTFSTHSFLPFPTVDVTALNGPPPNAVIDTKYIDVVVNFHGAEGAGNSELPASTGIASYEVLGHHGAAEPGRLRSGYNLGVLTSVPYADSTINGVAVTIPCPTSSDDTFVAVGLEYVDGVQSVLVGRSQAIECDPNIAEPDDKPSIQPRRQRLGRARR